MNLMQQAYHRRRRLCVQDPALRLIEEEDKYRLVAHIPGVPASHVKVVLLEDEQVVRLSALDPVSKNMVLQKAVHYNDVADPHSTSAWCQDGVLEVTMHKVEAPKPFDIQVQGGEPPETERKRYELRRNVPGLSATDVKVHVNGTTLFIEAREGLSSSECAERDNDATLADFALSATQQLPEDANVQEACAYVSHGVLTVRVPQALDGEPVRIGVYDDEQADDELKTWDQLAFFHVPGFNQDDICIHATHGYLKIEVDRSKKIANAKIWERYVILPDELVDLSKVKATCDNGLLRILFSKEGLRHPKEREVIVSKHRPSMHLGEESHENLV